MIENYDQKLSQIIFARLQKGNKCYSLLLAKPVHVCNYIKNAFHHGRSSSSFPNFSDLKTFWQVQSIRPLCCVLPL